MVEFWIQIENHAWDVCPNNVDRMMGQQIQDPATAPVIGLTSPVTHVSHGQKMFKPLGNGDALILRSYTKNWAAPIPARVNPWDLNEPDPSDNGTMGTIPGATIECNVGDQVTVHFRNMDNRLDPNGNLLPVERRTHSLHPHGFVFDPINDGAFPMSPPSAQAIPAAEAATWNSLPASIRPTGGFKIGDRVPPGATFDYTWQTFGWPTTAGVWLYHDHSICSDENVNQGAIGTIVIHPTDSLDTAAPDLPGGSVVGSLLDANNNFIQPPKNAQYLLLFHELGDQGMCINGRKFLGNTPTLIAGTNTQIRFGVVGMGSDTHTFHLHGHRWIIPGPAGNDPLTIQNSKQSSPISQFEDTRLFGPANSFSLTIIKGPLPNFPQSFMDSAPGSLGEFHLHCHVLAHMADGMMGSLLVVQKGQPFTPLSQGVMCPPIPAKQVTVPASNVVEIDAISDSKNPTGFSWNPNNQNVSLNDMVKFVDKSGDPHSIVWDMPNPMNAPKPQNLPTGTPNQVIGQVQMTAKGTFPYHCGVHGPTMNGTIVVS